MNSAIGSFGLVRTPGLGQAANEPAEPASDAAEPEHAAGLVAAMKPQPSRAERLRMAEDAAQSADDSVEPSDDTPPASAGPMFGIGVQPPTHRMPGDGAPITRVDRRRKRRC